ncbi:MAG: GWxTD domain-containing protein [Candidatus Latescibacterota bacterium]
MHFPRIRPVFYCIVVVLLFAVISDGHSQGRRYSLYAHSFLGDDHQPHVRVTANIPYSIMVFLKKNDLYEAAFDLYIRLLDEDGRLIESAVMKDRAVVASYEETHARTNVSKLAKSFIIQPGDYTIEALLVIRNTLLRIPNTVEVKVPHFLSSGVGMSIPRLFAIPREELPLLPPLRDSRFLQGIMTGDNEANSLFGFDTQLALGFEIYTESPGGDSIPCDILYEVLDHDERQILYGRGAVRISGSGDPFIVSFNVDEWEPGAYTFRVKAVIDNPIRETASSRDFTIEFNRAMLGKFFSQTMEMLSLIASRGELEDLKHAASEDRSRAWVEFWKQRDPTPGTDSNEALEEHLRRVRYVSEQFGSVDPGWKTDRGRVYIQHGDPDQIETATDPYMQGEYLIWRYYSHNMVFVFYDRFGLGDYRLIRTNMF